MVSHNFFDTPQGSEDITSQLAGVRLLTEFLQCRQCDGVGLVRATQPGQSFRLKPEYRRPASGSFFRRKRGDEQMVLDGLGKAWSAGVGVDWASVFDGLRFCCISMNKVRINLGYLKRWFSILDCESI